MAFRSPLLVFAVHDLGQAGGRSLDTFGELLGIQAADGMLHDDQSWGDLARLGLRKNERFESLGRDDVSRDALLLQFDAVVETPR